MGIADYLSKRQMLTIASGRLVWLRVPRLQIQMRVEEAFSCPRARYVVRPDRMRSMRIPRRSPFVVSWTRYGNGLNGRHLWEPRN